MSAKGMQVPCLHTLEIVKEKRIYRPNKNPNHGYLERILTGPELNSACFLLVRTEWRFSFLSMVPK